MFHYQSVLEVQDECPMVLCFSNASGTGICSSVYINMHDIVYNIIYTIERVMIA